MIVEERVPSGLSSSRKAFATALAIASCLFLATAASAGAAGSKPGGAAKPAGAELTIQTWPEGVFGYVSSAAPERCAGNRRIELFEQTGEGRDPTADRRVAVVRAGGKAAAYQWAVKTSQAGSLYAFAARAPGCAAATSAALDARPLGGQVERGDYPPCGPYVSEGTSFICKFEELHASVEGSYFSGAAGSVDGKAVYGPAPWGTSVVGLNPEVNFAWNWSQRWVRFVAYRYDQGTVGTAFLSGSMPSATSDKFSISDAFAQNDRGREVGDHFYTPDLPGQEAGQVGGPLHLNFIAPDGAFAKSQVYISGYLYLKRW